ncbi:MAG: GNAT family N-acetyltransferase [Ruminococcus sp.]|nr:GNAT family N-acetyltransferase [Candidatus Apopatosoma intestinale]
MEIRKTRPEDLPRLLAIYERARAFMAQTGNPDQWGSRHWPPEELLREDIAASRSFVCEKDGAVVGTFCYLFGDRIDETYHVIDGAWSADEAYGVVHRIASDGTKGVGTFCLGWALEQNGYLRIDTHEDNQVMRNLLAKLGFRYCGVIRLPDGDPRLAYDKKK